MRKGQQERESSGRYLCSVTPTRAIGLAVLMVLVIGAAVGAGMLIGKFALK
jgi:hypothetical protein